MALRTSVQTGLWSASDTWDTGVPENTDTFLIAAGHTVTFDADQSGFASGMGASKINGILKASETAGAYYLKMSGSITTDGGGTIQAGTDEANKYPANCSFTIWINNVGSFYIDVPNIKLYCQDPVLKYATLISNPGGSVGARSLPIQSISQGYPCTVRCDGHGLANNANLVLLNLGDTHPLNNCVLRVATATDANNFTVKYFDPVFVLSVDAIVDSTDFPAYVSGGTLNPITATATGDKTIYLDQTVTAWGAGADKNVLLINGWRQSSLVQTLRPIDSNGDTSLTFVATVGFAFVSRGIALYCYRNVRIINSSVGVGGMIRNATNSQFDAEIRPLGANALVGCTGRFTCGLISGGTANTGILNGEITVTYHGASRRGLKS